MAERGPWQTHFDRFQSLYTQTCADLAQIVGELPQLAEAQDYTSIDNAARALVHIAADAAYQKGEMEIGRQKLAEGQP